MEKSVISVILAVKYLKSNGYSLTKNITNITELQNGGVKLKKQGINPVFGFLSIKISSL
jgi:hypothetical protein